MKLLNNYISENLFGHDSIDDQIDSNYWETLNKTINQEINKFFIGCNNVEIINNELNISLKKDSSLLINDNFISFIKKYNDVFKKINIINNTFIRLETTVQIPIIYEDFVNDLLSKLIFYRIIIRKDPMVKLDLKIGYFMGRNTTIFIDTELKNIPNIIFININNNINNIFNYYCGNYDILKKLKIGFNSVKDNNVFKKIPKEIYIYDDTLFSEIDKLFKNKENDTLDELLNEKIYKFLPKPNPNKDRVIINSQSVDDNNDYLIEINLRGSFVVTYTNYNNKEIKTSIL